MSNYINIAVVINLKDAVLIECSSIMYNLEEKYAINFIKNNQVAPHITLCIGKILEKDLNKIVEKLEYIFINLQIFKIETNGLGIFLLDNINLYLRWKRNINLINFRNHILSNLKDIWVEDIKYNNQLEWIPKTTLAFNDINYDNMSKINYGIIRFDKKYMNVEKISIIQYEKNKEEKELETFILNKEINNE